jgi:hypothetical protein
VNAAPTIEIYCDDSHPENRYSVARFARTSRGWELLAQWRHADVDNVNPRKRRRREDTVVCIDDRLSYNLFCDCGVTVPVRDERLQPILDTAHNGGVGSLSLTALSARLRRSGTR